MADKDKDKTNNGQSNEEDNLNPFAEPDNNNNSDKETQQQQPQKTAAELAEEGSAKIKDFFETSGLYKNLDFSKFLTAVNDSNVEDATVFLQTIMQNAVTSALIGAEKLTNAKVAKAIEAATDKATAVTRNDLAIEKMHQRFSFTNDVKVSPVAESVLNGFIAQGQSVDTALDSVEKYFQSTLEAAGKQFGFTKKPQGDTRPGKGGFADSNANLSQNDNGDDERQTDDFVDILTSGNQTFETVNPSSHDGDK